MITKFVFIIISITSWQLREAICHFSLSRVVPIMHEQNIICSKTCLKGTMHEQTIICSQLFAGHVVGSQPLERKKTMRRMIMKVIWTLFFKCKLKIILTTWTCHIGWIIIFALKVFLHIVSCYECLPEKNEGSLSCLSWQTKCPINWPNYHIPLRHFCYL